jgi:hypothetical protein
LTRKARHKLQKLNYLDLNLRKLDYLDININELNYLDMGTVAGPKLLEKPLFGQRKFLAEELCILGLDSKQLVEDANLLSQCGVHRHDFLYHRQLERC